MDRGACWAIVHRVTKSWTRLKSLNTHAHKCYNRSKPIKTHSKSTEKAKVKFPGFGELFTVRGWHWVFRKPGLGREGGGSRG